MVGLVFRFLFNVVALAYWNVLLFRWELYAHEHKGVDQDQVR